MASSSDLPFKLRVEQAFTFTGRGTVIAGRFLQGTIRNGAELELVADGQSGDAGRTYLECESYDFLCESDWDPSKGVALGVIVRGISPDEIVPGSFLQAAVTGPDRPVTTA